MKYVFIDTNIFISCAFLERKGDTVQQIEKLSQLINSNSIKLLLPEIVEIELERKTKDQLITIKSQVEKLKNTVIKSFPGSLLTDKSNLLKEIDGMFKKREVSSHSASKKLNKIFKSENVIKIPLYQKIFFNAYKRALKGLKPSKAERKIIIDQDCLIIESINNSILKFVIKELIFCSANVNDFALKKDTKNKFVIHPELVPPLPKETRFYNNLPEMFDIEFNLKISEDESKSTKLNLEYLTGLESMQTMFSKLAEGMAISPEILKGMAISPEILKGMALRTSSIQSENMEKLQEGIYKSVVNLNKIFK